MKWNSKIGKIYTTQRGTTRAHLYYYIRHEGAHTFKAGRFWFNREVDYERESFTTLATAKRYCEMKDREAVIIEEVSA